MGRELILCSFRVSSGYFGVPKNTGTLLGVTIIRLAGFRAKIESAKIGSGDV